MGLESRDHMSLSRVVLPIVSIGNVREFRATEQGVVGDIFGITSDSIASSKHRVLFQISKIASEEAIKLTVASGSLKANKRWNSREGPRGIRLRILRLKELIAGLRLNPRTARWLSRIMKPVSRSERSSVTMAAISRIRQGAHTLQMDDADPLVESKINIPNPAPSLNIGRQVPLSSKTSVKLCVLIASCELVKVVGAYAIRYYNDDKFPVDQTLFVVLLELSKALVCFFLHVTTHNGSAWTPFNWRLLLPSMVYAITNNIFFFSLAYVTPAVWMVLVQTRIPLTLLLYKVFFRRSVSEAQWIGAFLMCFAIGISQLPELSAGASHGLTVGFVLALLNSVLSASAAVYTELLFKNPQQSNIWKQQFQMYIGGAGFAVVPFVYSSFVFRKEIISEAPWSIWGLLGITWITAAVHGICVALLVKKLDNVVKYQVACVVHLLNSGLNQLLFPDRFTLTPHFAISLLVLFYAVHVYENKTFTLSKR